MFLSSYHFYPFYILLKKKKEEKEKKKRETNKTLILTLISNPNTNPKQNEYFQK